MQSASHEKISRVPVIAPSVYFDNAPTCAVGRCESNLRPPSTNAREMKMSSQSWFTLTLHLEGLPRPSNLTPIGREIHRHL
ncbi:hypothetical protein AHF37_07897 [Paragonimus kellicotti]|nr:hypothetical protein AHF37_07897 [Paragonimus kellicotti]